MSYRCADCAWAGPRCSPRLVQPRQGPVASARSCARSYAIDHHGNKQSLEPILHRATKHICFCEMLAAATTDPRRAARVQVPVLANLDPKARSALRICKEGNYYAQSICSQSKVPAPNGGEFRVGASSYRCQRPRPRPIRCTGKGPRQSGISAPGGSALAASESATRPLWTAGALPMAPPGTRRAPGLPP